MLGKSTKKKEDRMCIIAITNAGMKQDDIVRVLSTALAKNHAKPAKGDTSHVTKMNLFCFFPIDYVLK